MEGIVFLAEVSEIRFLGFNNILNASVETGAPCLILINETGNKKSNNASRPGYRRILKITPSELDYSEGELKKIRDAEEVLKYLSLDRLGENPVKKMDEILKDFNYLVKSNIKSLYEKKDQEIKVFDLEYIDEHKIDMNKTIVYGRYGAGTSFSLRNSYGKKVRGEDKIKIYKTEELPKEKVYSSFKSLVNNVI